MRRRRKKGFLDQINRVFDISRKVQRDFEKSKTKKKVLDSLQSGLGIGIKKRKNVLYWLPPPYIYKEVAVTKSAFISKQSGRMKRSLC